MKTNPIAELFRKHDDEYLMFVRVQDKTSQRADMHAFMLLDKLFPGTPDMVTAAEHDEIFLWVEPEELVKTATEDQIVDLIRCGVRFDSETNSLAMFV